MYNKFSIPPTVTPEYTDKTNQKRPNPRPYPPLTNFLLAYTHQILAVHFHPLPTVFFLAVAVNLLVFRHSRIAHPRHLFRQDFSNHRTETHPGFLQKIGLRRQIPREITIFLCYRTYLSKIIRIFAALLEEKTRKDVQTAFRNAEDTKLR